MTDETDKQLRQPFIEQHYASEQLVTASRGRRLGAYVLDGLIVAIVVAVGVFVGLFFLASASLGDPEERAVGLIMWAIGGLFSLAIFGAYLYWLGSTWLYGQSPGKHWLGLYVIDQNAFRASGRHMLAREILVKFLFPGLVAAVLGLIMAALTSIPVWATDGGAAYDLASLVVAIVAPAWILWDRNRQALWDKVTKTYVAHSANGFVPLSRKEASPPAPRV